MSEQLLQSVQASTKKGKKDVVKPNLSEDDCKKIDTFKGAFETSKNELIDMISEPHGGDECLMNNLKNAVKQNRMKEYRKYLSEIIRFLGLDVQLNQRMFEHLNNILITINRSISLINSANIISDDRTYDELPKNFISIMFDKCKITH